MDRIECTKEHPWDRVRRPGIRIVHMESHEVGDQEDGYPGGDIVTMECPNCGSRWKEELPQ